jgi:hypothetical protein
VKKTELELRTGRNNLRVTGAAVRVPTLVHRRSQIIPGAGVVVVGGVVTALVPQGYPSCWHRFEPSVAKQIPLVHRDGIPFTGAEDRLL